MCVCVCVCVCVLACARVSFLHLSCRYQEQIDQVVRQIAHLNQEKNHYGEASKETSKMVNDIKKEHAKLRDRLREMYVWQSAASDDPYERVELPQDAVKGMLQGEPAPWHVGGASSSLKLILGRRFFVAINDQARCEEQLSVLPVERKRMRQWLEVMLDLISGRIGVMEQHGQVQGGQHVAPWLLTPQHGAVFWLKVHAKRLAAMLSQTNSLKW